MSKTVRVAMIAGVAGWCVIATSGTAQACWCNRVYTSYYVDPCTPCTVPTVSYYAPQTTCSTASIQRCYSVPQLTYQTVTRMYPQSFLVRRSYYDPLSCSYRSYYVPTMQFVERSYYLPVTTYVQRCYSEPQTVCSTTYVSTGTNGCAVPAQTPATEAVPADQNQRNSLQQPLYRERSPNSNGSPPPKPSPMPAPQSSRRRSFASR